VSAPARVATVSSDAYATGRVTSMIFRRALLLRFALGRTTAHQGEEVL
jgi:hypothetical protein